jgi:heptosyltransferase III
MRLAERVERKASYLWRRYISDGVLAEWLAPAFAPLLFPAQSRAIPSPDSVRSVLVWNVDSFGDFLFVTPLLRALREGYKQAKIDLVLNEGCMSLAETNPNIDRLIPVRPAPYYTGTGYFRMPPELIGQAYDVVLIAEMGTRPADAARVVARRLKTRYIASGNLGLLKSLADFTLPANKSEYWPAYYLRLATSLGLPGVAAQMEVFPSETDLAQAEAILGAKTRRRRVGFHPMVAAYALTTKKWPDESFLELGKYLHSQTPTEVIITGSADEASGCEALASKLRQFTVPAKSVAGQLTLRGTVALYQQLDLVVTGDTAALHLATSAKVPTVALFGATDEKRLAAPETLVMKEDLPCRPCHKVTDRRPEWPKCHYERPWCLHRITAEAVGRQSLSLLKK